jgi:kinetochore protein NNF1
MAAAPLSQNPPDSPTAAPPQPTLPGVLATRLQETYAHAIAKIISTCSYDSFATCFPTPAQNRPEVLRSVWSQIVAKIEAKANEEFEGIMQERAVVKRLNELEGLVGGARERRKRGGEGEIVP